MEDNEYPMKVIAHIHNDFPTKFALPRQSGLVPELMSEIVFEKEYQSQEAIRGLEKFSHLWILWLFDKAVRDGWTPTVRPPRLGGNQRMGVFATRSPFRPNPIGLTCVKLIRVEKTKENGSTLVVSGGDMMDGTPVFDIKPYIPYADAVSDASGGFTEEILPRHLDVRIEGTLLEKLPQNMRQTLTDVLAQDPRPGYQHDPERIYGFDYGKFSVKFCVDGNELTVTQLEERKM